MPKRKIYFRADGNAKMGLGHVIRSLALADMLRNDFDCHFIIRQPLPTLKEQILKICKSIVEIPQTENDIQEAQLLASSYLEGNEIVVLDGYHFITAYQQAIKDKGCKVVCIDDIYAYHFVADMIINHAGGITPEHYSAEASTKFSLGLQFALLRKPFREAAKKREYPDREKDSVFICLGGADPQNDTIKVLQKCEAIKEIKKCYLVIGGAYSHKAELEEYITKTKLDIELLSNLSEYEMVKYMSKSSKAITPPSTISFEYLSVGGELYLKQIASNQNSIKDYFLGEGLAFTFDDFPKKDMEMISFSLKKQRQLIDANIDQRFIEQFKTL